MSLIKLAAEKVINYNFYSHNNDPSKAPVIPAIIAGSTATFGVKELADHLVKNQHLGHRWGKNVIATAAGALAGYGTMKALEKKKSKDVKPMATITQPIS